MQADQSNIRKPTSNIDVDPAVLWLCQLPEMTPALALRLIATFGTAEAVMRAPSRALRAVGASPTLISRIVAGARAVPQVAAGLAGLGRLGITPLALLSPHYPDRLKALPQPPLVLYIQGPWPIAQPVCLVIAPPELDPSIADAWAALRATVSQHIAWAALDESSLEAPRLLGVPWGLLLARRHLTHDGWQAVSNDATTLLSTVPPTTHGDAAAVAAVADVLIALADAIMLLPGAATERVMATAGMLSQPVFAIAPPRASLPPGVSRLWGAAGARRLMRMLGIHHARGGTARQERLF